MNNNLLERCAGMDVHKKTVVVCIKIGIGDAQIKKIKTFGTTTPMLRQLLSFLKEHKIKEAAIESTGPYWIPVYNIMEDDINITLTNPQHMKNIPGKKTDVKDAEWICDLLKHGLLNKSFIPPKAIRQLRDLTRLRKKWTQQRISALNRVIKFLECANIKLKSVASNIGGAFAWNVIKAISEGTTDPQILAALVKGRIKATNNEIIDALTGTLQEHNIKMICFAVQEIEFYNTSLQQVEESIKKASETFKKELDIIKSFPGAGQTIANTVISEIGVNMAQFPSGNHITSWAGLVPGNNESAGKTKSTRITKGNSFLKTSLLQCAWAAVREKDGYWRSLYYRLRSRLGAKKAIIAVTRRILQAIHEALTLGINYQELDLKDSSDNINKRMKYYEKKIEELKKQAIVFA